METEKFERELSGSSESIRGKEVSASLVNRALGKIASKVEQTLQIATFIAGTTFGVGVLANQELPIKTDTTEIPSTPQKSLVLKNASETNIIFSKSITFKDKNGVEHNATFGTDDKGLIYEIGADQKTTQVFSVDSNLGSLVDVKKAGNNALFTVSNAKTNVDTGKLDKKTETSKTSISIPLDLSGQNTLLPAQVEKASQELSKLPHGEGNILYYDYNAGLGTGTYPFTGGTLDGVTVKNNLGKLGKNYNYSIDQNEVKIDGINLKNTKASLLNKKVTLSKKVKVCDEAEPTLCVKINSKFDVKANPYFTNPTVIKQEIVENSNGAFNSKTNQFTVSSGSMSNSINMYADLGVPPTTAKGGKITFISGDPTNTTVDYNGNVTVSNPDIPGQVILVEQAVNDKNEPIENQSVDTSLVPEGIDGGGISNPEISMPNQTINDEGGFGPIPLPAPTVTGVMPGAVYEMVGDPTEGKLTINPTNGVLTWEGNIIGPAFIDYSIQIKVTNLDNGTKSASFNLHVNNNL